MKTTVMIAAAIATFMGFAPVAAATHAAAPAGGANQKQAVEGCMHQWLFNGVWRLRVNSVEPNEVSGQPGYAVAIQIRNGAHKTITLGNTGVDGSGRGVDLVTDDGESLTLDALDYQYLGFKDIIQGGGASRKLLYHFSPGTQDAASKKPAKFIMLIDPNAPIARGRVRYSVKDPSFRVNLTCDAAQK